MTAPGRDRPASLPGDPTRLPLAGQGHERAGTASAPFSYACRRCNRCCRDRRIQVNPYEVLRLARNRGISTGELVDRHVDPSLVSLRRRPDGTCVFLGPSGCTVHADRPLVCRLYPLGRVVRGAEEAWVVLPEAAGSEGVRGTDGQVEEYVRAQGAEPYLRAADVYHAVVERMMLARPGEIPSSTPADAAPVNGRWLLDVDAHVQTTGDPERDLHRHAEFLLEVLALPE